MFIGEYKHIIDEKGRLAIPAKFRNRLEKGAVVTRGLDNCLCIYTKDEWEKLAERLASLPMAKANTRAFARFMLAGAMDCEVDKQGRIMLPDYLRKYAVLAKNVVLAGLYNRLEIWSDEKWEQHKTETEKTSANIAEELGGLGV
jgi:MraZ protein